MKLSLNFGSAVVSLPAATIGYLDKADPLTLKLYLHLAAEAELRESFDAADFAKRFAVTVKEVEEGRASKITFYIETPKLESVKQRADAEEVSEE